MWYGGCYTSNQDFLFHVKSGAKEEGESEPPPRLQQRMRQAWGKKPRASNAFLIAREGKHLLVPFECDLCIFRKVQGGNPVLPNPQDSLLIACIRRASLDLFWSRAKGTASGNRDKVAFGIKCQVWWGSSWALTSQTDPSLNTITAVTK
jgi:hypothetical protein